MELKYKGQFNRDIDIDNSKVLNAVKDAVINVKKAVNISKINNLKKLKKYAVHYRIKIAENYRIGLIIRKNTVWFVRFGHRNTFYKYFA
jgi:mRNA-degrading endonuclease RelE of RelBE toxin-antitoxin system